MEIASPYLAGTVLITDGTALRVLKVGEAVVGQTSCAASGQPNRVVWGFEIPDRISGSRRGGFAKTRGRVCLCFGARGRSVWAKMLFILGGCPMSISLRRMN